jgi:predicted HTH domain antitoxin
MIAPRDLVEARLYMNEQEVVQEALHVLLHTHPALRIQLAIHRYQTGDISMAKAASLAGLSWEQMRDALIDQNIQLRPGTQTLEETPSEIQTLREYEETYETTPRSSQLGQKLREIRAEIIDSGEPLLDWDELEQEIASRRCGRETDFE